MKDTVAVTLLIENIEEDYDLPCNIPLRELYTRLKTVLNKSFSTEYNSILFQSGQGVLDNLNATLFDYGVQIGTKLIVRKVK